MTIQPMALAKEYLELKKKLENERKNKNRKALKKRHASEAKACPDSTRDRDMPIAV